MAATAATPTVIRALGTSPRVGTASAATGPGDPYLGRAIQAAKDLQRAYAVAGCDGLYRDFLPVIGRPYASIWTYGELLHASLALEAATTTSPLPVTPLFGPGLAAYWDTTGPQAGYGGYLQPPFVGADGRWYDDNCWIALELIRAYDLFGDTGALGGARTTFAFVASGWDTDPTKPFPGGVFWAEPPDKRSRNTCSNAPAAQVALGLAERTGDPAMLAWAKRTIDWLRNALRDPADGLYWDNIRMDGTIDQTKWSYNQGTPVGALVGLARLTRGDDPTGAAALITEAEDLARAALEHYGRSATSFMTQLAWFNAVFFRNLLELADVTADAGLATSIRTSLVSYAEETWASNRGGDGLFRFEQGYGLPYSLQQAAMVSVNLLAAQTTGLFPRTPAPATLFQPEPTGWSDRCVAGALEPTSATTTPAGPTSTSAPEVTGAITTGSASRHGTIPAAHPIAGHPTYTG